MKVTKMIAGLDIGNGYVKGTAQAEDREPMGIDFLSGVALETNSSGVKAKGADIPGEIENIYNMMEASFDTKAIRSHTARLFGQRASRSGKALEEFDVASPTSKAMQDLSAILILGSLAGAALQDYYAVNKKLPDEIIQVDARIAIALPITEYKTYRKMYIDKFRDQKHMVMIQNFETPVRVEILVSDVQVLAEGASALFAIVQYGEDLMKVMMDDLKAHGEPLEGITAQDILNASNTIGIDIGEGTVNFPVFQDGRFNVDASITFPKGYGTILEQARERLQMEGFSFASRKQLADFLLSKDTALTAGRKAKVKQIIAEETEGFVQELGIQFKKVLARVGSYIEVIYVYGGGANDVKDQLYPFLIETAKQYSGGEMAYPILYLGSGYSRHLNKEGLFIIAQEIAAQKAGK